MASRLFDPASPDFFRLSRSKLELFVQCAQCFWLDRRLGVSRPDSPPYTLNNAVDVLLKKEFDVYRLQGKPHPLMQLYGIDAVPFKHPALDAWRDVRRGMTHDHAASGFQFFGAVDDVWQGSDDLLMIVDYKATSTQGPVSIDGVYRQSYKRQLEMYQWLLAKQGFGVSPVGFFVYANADKDKPAFDRKLEFTMTVLPYEGDASWVEDALMEARRCLDHDTAPPYAEGCEWCRYRRAVTER